MPSILKLLQEGAYQRWLSKEIKSVISHGLKEEVKKSRFFLLTYQNRMHPEISRISRELFYEGKALKDSCIAKTEREWECDLYPRKVVWIDIPYRKEDIATHVGWSYWGEIMRNVNRKEAEVILEELDKFISWVNQNPKGFSQELRTLSGILQGGVVGQSKKYTILILCFYKGQKKYIRNLLRKKYPENRGKQTRFNVQGHDVRVYTIDDAQGKEGDIVFLSMTQNQRVGFLDSPNRLNVAITRAKYQLVIVGDRNWFMRGQRRSFYLRELARMVEPMRP